MHTYPELRQNTQPPLLAVLKYGIFSAATSIHKTINSRQKKSLDEKARIKYESLLVFLDREGFNVFIFKDVELCDEVPI